MKEITTAVGIVAQGIMAAIITGAIVGAFFGSAWSTFLWVVE